MSTQRAAPVWAILGAPAVGVPLIIGLLTFTAPSEVGTGTGSGHEGDAGHAVTTEERVMGDQVLDGPATDRAGREGAAGTDQAITSRQF